MTSIALKQPPSAARDPGLEALRPTWYEIDLDAIAENFRSLRAAVGPDVAIYACLKRNAYGCGAVAVARRLAREGAEGLALGNIYDAIAIRAAGVDLPILLYPTCLPEQAETLRRHDLMASVSSAEEAVAWDVASPRPPEGVRQDRRRGLPRRSPAARRRVRPSRRSRACAGWSSSVPTAISCFRRRTTHTRNGSSPISRRRLRPRTSLASSFRCAWLPARPWC